MRNGAILAILAAGCLANAVELDTVPVWRQLAFVVAAVAAYLHGRHLPVRRAWPVFLVAAAVCAGFTVADFWVGTGMLAAVALFAGLPWLAGRFRRQQAELVAAGRERVAHLERERELVAEHAALRERARIASELHDALGHELALLSLRAGALELVPDLPESHRAAVAEVRAGAVAATDRLREAVGVLWEHDAGAPPAADTVADLVDRAREAGMDVSADLPPWPLGGDVHRVVREALTNAARHAPGTPVSLRANVADDDTLEVTVSNPVNGASAGRGSGTGLATLRERLRGSGGTLTVDSDGQRFAVTARWPVTRPDGGDR